MFQSDPRQMTRKRPGTWAKILAFSSLLMLPFGLWKVAELLRESISGFCP
jgi:hypothetical protein